MGWPGALCCCTPTKLWIRNVREREREKNGHSTENLALMHIILLSFFPPTFSWPKQQWSSFSNLFKSLITDVIIEILYVSSMTSLLKGKTFVYFYLKHLSDILFISLT